MHNLSVAVAHVVIFPHFLDITHCVTNSSSVITQEPTVASPTVSTFNTPTTVTLTTGPTSSGEGEPESTGIRKLYELHNQLYMFLIAANGIGLIAGVIVAIILSLGLVLVLVAVVLLVIARYSHISILILHELFILKTRTFQ